MTKNKPGGDSANYQIRGTKGTSRKEQPTKKQQHNMELRTRRCVVCLHPRPAGSFPICSNCTRF